MIEINEKIYHLCLLDTNALSNFLIKPKEWIQFFNKRYDISKTIISYSIFTLAELWSRQELFEKYIDIFSEFPSGILDGHESIFNKEIDKYKGNESINPIVIAPFAITEPGLSKKEILIKLINNSVFVDRAEYWKTEQNDVLEGMLSLKKNFPPKKGKYMKKEIEEFNMLASVSQIGIRNPIFARSFLNRNEEIDLNYFKSVVCTSYIVFYKFYIDRRKPQTSDVFDIIISSILPYIDYFITEGNLKEIVETIRKRHRKLDNILEVISVNEINREISI